MRPVVLFRASLTEEAERAACSDYFEVIDQRANVRANTLVIPRYSALPYYEEFEKDIQLENATLINSWREHCYVADLRNWYYDLGDYTPRTWFYMDQLPDKGPFFLKGQTNSRKHSWNTHAYAETKSDAMRVFGLLSADSYIGSQQIYARQFVPLRKLCDGLQGLPISEEYRFFVLDGVIVSGGFYWSNHTEHITQELGIAVSPDVVPRDFLSKVINIVAPNIRFFVIDVARTAEGEWIVVEVNDGQQSGLSDNDPHVLYGNMAKLLTPRSLV